MSSASRSNVSSKPSGNSNGGSGALVSGYNPVLGKFHTVDTTPPSSVPPVRTNSRFSSIDETNDPSGISIGSGKEYDTVSNNSSWSIDSEDHKEKTTHHVSPIQPDYEKREKIRQKNEKKHQRQREKRAQELHDRCIGFLMSRKLDVLSKQLVAMGFSSEGATMALILNQGKIEESISWLIEEGNGADKHKERNLHMGNLKIDVSEELARIADMKISYKCSKQDVERATVSCEGDLEKAEETLKSSQNAMITQPKPSMSNFVEHKGREKDLSSEKTDVAIVTPLELKRELQQDIKKSQPNIDSTPSSQESSSQPWSETQYMVLEKEFRNHPLAKQEPFVLLQRPQSDNPKGSLNVNSNLSLKQMYNESQHMQGGVNSGTGDKKRNSPTISVASSLGLYSGSGSTSCSSGPSSPVDWNSNGSLLQFDYTNVDWTLNPSPPRSNSTITWQGIVSAMQNDTRRYEQYSYSSASTPQSWGFREWSSPFEERDIFRLPWKFVTPSL